MDKLYKELIKEFPPEAYQLDDSRGFDLTSIKAQYIKERLCEVFTPFGWKIFGEHIEKENGVLFIGKFEVKLENNEWFSVQATGYARKGKNIGDTYKSATTDALSKAASNIGVGNSAFKGLIKPPTRTNKPQKIESPKYIVPFGIYKDKPINKIPTAELRDYCTNLKSPNNTQDEIAFLNTARIYLRGIK